MPGGEIHVYFANEFPFPDTAEQEISLVRSRDGGETLDREGLFWHFPGYLGAGTVEFIAPLPVPELAPSRVEDGVRVFELSAQEGTRAFVPQGETATLGYNGSYLGPTLVAARGIYRALVQVCPGQFFRMWHRCGPLSNRSASRNPDEGPMQFQS